MESIKTDICYNCGADQGLHHWETLQCPLGGIEETRFIKLTGKYYPQEWMDTTFEDSGIKKLEDAAPELLEVCEKAISLVDLWHPNPTIEEIKECNIGEFAALSNMRSLLEKAIKKATE